MHRIVPRLAVLKYILWETYFKAINKCCFLAESRTKRGNDMCSFLRFAGMMQEMKYGWSRLYMFTDGGPTK